MYINKKFLIKLQMYFHFDFHDVYLYYERHIACSSQFDVILLLYNCLKIKSCTFMCLEPL